MNNFEQCYDTDGNIYQLNVVRNESTGIMFKIKDIISLTEINNLEEIILNKKNGYKIDFHYKSIKKHLYLTYLGLVRVLFVSNSGQAEKFQQWAINILFTNQFGTTDQKKSLVANMLGVSATTVKAVFNKDTHKLPCIYLFSIGKVKDLRKVLNISDEIDGNLFVYKWGMTDDLERRTGEHNRYYGKIGGTVELVLYCYIDPTHMSRAETKIKTLMTETELKLNNKKYIELAIIPSNKMKFIKDYYKTISEACLGHVREMTLKLDKMETEKELLEKDKQLLAKDNDLLDKDLLIANTKIKSLEKKVSKMKKTGSKSSKR